MFATVILVGSLERLVIPLKYILSLDIVQVYNRGISRTKKHIIYYSSDDTDEPNFHLPIQDEFNANEPACYYAHILNVFGKFEIEMKHKNNLMSHCYNRTYYFIDTKEHALQYRTGRKILPAIYNSNAERFHWDPPNIAVTTTGAVELIDAPETPRQRNGDATESNASTSSNRISGANVPEANQNSVQPVNVSTDRNNEADIESDNSFQEANDSLNAVGLNDDRDEADDNGLELSNYVNDNEADDVASNDSLRSENTAGLDRIVARLPNTASDDIDSHEMNQDDSNLGEAAQDTDPLQEAETHANGVQIKKENAFDGSIISLSDDSSDNLVPNDDEFEDLRNVLAYNSDDDVDEQIQKEFDYLVSLGKLPMPMLVKDEKDEESIAQAVAGQATDSPSIESDENSELAGTNVIGTEIDVSTLLTEPPSTQRHEVNNISLSTEPIENVVPESTPSNVTVADNADSTSNGSNASNGMNVTEQSIGSDSRTKGRSNDQSANACTNLVVTKKEPIDSAAASSSSNRNSSTNDYDSVAGHYEIIRKVIK